LITGQQKSELKRIDEERKAEIEQVVEKYLKKRDAIIDALVAKEISLIVERYLCAHIYSLRLHPRSPSNFDLLCDVSHEHEKQAILAQIKVKSIQL
jgi:hypothetical protein